MKRKESATKERIVAATISLIMENKDVNEIPISSIAARAEVGVGLINYHFQTKENLINQCVQQVIGQLFGSFADLGDNLDHLPPAEKLKSIIKFIASFMVMNSELARISTLTDLAGGKENDGSALIMKTYFPILKEAYGATHNDQELQIILHTIISTIQVTFLRSSVNQELFGFDFLNEEQRNEFIDKLVDLFRSDKDI